ncbi:DUF1499 domain-containing protein [Aliishimia ponticola]|uniref:DUF1499 domain-containing protein n=1 Tax=Aliishimia ponticola TaxID=2499833 RepID=A0A4S4NFQ2_9RHOB|nr:DUF1499 domain-containing protein [Aliishimia ponticola]THH38436.1 DUF1499 domain-containing protein [Aliishimia ponticola]
MLFWVILLLVVGLLAFIRLAPSDPARWHQPVTAQADKDMASGAIRVLPGDAATLARLKEIALQTPRTEVLAGSVEEGRITFVTRSKVMGFPDYTTADLQDEQLRLFARLRFGKSDLGVNAKRLEGWLAQL